MDTFKIISCHNLYGKRMTAEIIRKADTGPRVRYLLANRLPSVPGLEGEPFQHHKDYTCRPATTPDGRRLSLYVFCNRVYLVDRKPPVSTVRDLQDDYRQQDLCAAEFLASEKVPEGMTFEQAFEFYIEVMKTVEGDTFTVTKEGITQTL